MTTTSSSLMHDAIVAGAGPVGLFLACELALAGCAVLVLERAAEPSTPSIFKRMPFGIRGLSAPSIEALDRRGLLQALGGAGSRPVRGGHFAGIQFRDSAVDMTHWPWRLPSSTDVQSMAEMAQLEALLAHRAAQLGVEIRRGAGVTGVDQDADGVRVDAAGQVFAARWLVGCDGGRSTVRKLAGFDFAGTEPEFTGYSIQADIVDPDKLEPGRILTPAGLYFLPQPGYLVLQDFDGGAGHRLDAAPTREHVQSLLRRIAQTDVTLGAVHAVSTWTDRARQAVRYRQGRILLAGDAAHIHSPLGGQGLNLGLGDAMNLGWKLAATIQRTAPDGLLDSYHAERHPIGAQVLDWSRAQVAIMRPSPEGRALRAIFQDLMGTQDGATYVAGRVWNMAMHYDLGGGHPLVGRSVPNFAFDNGGTVNAALRTTCAGCGLLLDLSGRANPAHAALAQVYGGRIQALAARTEVSMGIGAVLVRPDGIVAWAADDGASDDGTLAHAAARWFGVKE